MARRLARDSSGPCVAGRRAARGWDEVHVAAGLGGGGEVRIFGGLCLGLVLSLMRFWLFFEECRFSLPRWVFVRSLKNPRVGLRGREPGALLGGVFQSPSLVPLSGYSAFLSGALGWRFAADRPQPAKPAAAWPGP